MSLRDTVRSVDEDLKLGTGRRLDAIVIGTLLSFVLVAPVVSTLTLGYSGIVSNILIFMLFAVAYNLLVGYTGIVSFGHAMFLGGAMYTVAMVTSILGSTLFFPGVVLALASVSLAAYLIGSVIADKGEIYFALLTIAFAEIVRYVANADPYGLTGGSDGIARGVLPNWIETYRGEAFVNLGGMEIAVYWFVGLVFVVSVYTIFRIVRSPFGRTLLTIRDNEQLARSIGIDTRMYKVYSFTISAFFSGIAGVLLVVVNQGVATSYLHWSMSGDILMMTVIGGLSSFVGPMFGAIIWFVSEDLLTSLDAIGDLRHYWKFLFGLLFVLVVLWSPEDGAWGLLKKRVLSLLERGDGQDGGVRRDE